MNLLLRDPGANERSLFETSGWRMTDAKCRKLPWLKSGKQITIPEIGVADGVSE